MVITAAGNVFLRKSFFTMLQLPICKGTLMIYAGAGHSAELLWLLTEQIILIVRGKIKTLKHWYGEQQIQKH